MDELNLYHTFHRQELDLQLLQGFESRVLSQSGEVSFANLLLVQRTIVFLNFFFNFCVWTCTYAIFFAVRVNNVGDLSEKYRVEGNFWYTSAKSFQCSVTFVGYLDKHICIKHMSNLVTKS